MNNIFQDLIDFVNLAERNRKYPSNTASGFKAAVRLFEVESNDEEKTSFDTFKSHLEQIYQSVFRTNKSKMVASSLLTYRKRLSTLMDDYEKYGIDPSKMSSWNRAVRVRRSSVSEKISKSNNGKEEVVDDKVIVMPEGPTMNKFELSLRPNVKAIILTPSDITKDEVIKVKKYIEYLESMTT